MNLIWLFRPDIFLHILRFIKISSFPLFFSGGGGRSISRKKSCHDLARQYRSWSLNCPNLDNTIKMLFTVSVVLRKQHIVLLCIYVLNSILSLSLRSFHLKETFSFILLLFLPPLTNRYISIYTNSKKNNAQRKNKNGVTNHNCKSYEKMKFLLPNEENM